MAWEHLSITRAHLVYIILGGFTSIFMLVSLFIKEKLYIGEATVATICGVIFGPHAANLINPLTWGNTDLITLEFSRIVLVVQCFAVGVELPKAYMERHWKSVVFLLVPVMTFGWLITSLFIWWMVVPLTWLESLICAACVTATDPVLASSVVGKGKFAKRVPKHLRDLLSAESGCNDGMAFPFVYLSIYLLRYHLDAAHVTYHWICYTVLYECIFGAVYGFLVGYIGRHAIKLAERKGIIDRESFLVFYFVLALFCAGSGSLLGTDDLLVGFAAGVGFSNDGWFTEKTEESHVSNVIDLLINLSYFVYFGTIVPWDQYNVPDHGLTPWRLVVIAIFVLLFRRIPVMLALKPFIPDVKTWREAMFAGHFGPIGVGAIFVAILARAELETESTEPLDDLPPPGSKDYDVIYLIWPITTFLVIASIVVHGSSIAVFTLGRRINTLQLTLSYTTDNEKGPAWMNRLPRISSQSRSMSRMSSFSDVDEKLDIPPGTLPPVGGLPKLMLRRQKEEDDIPGSPRSASIKPRRRKRKDRDSADRLGGPVSASAIGNINRPSQSQPSLAQLESGSETLFDKSAEQSPETKDLKSPDSSPIEEDGTRSRSISPGQRKPAQVEAYEEGDEMVVEDEEGNVLDVSDTRHKSKEEQAAMVEEIRNKLDQDQSGKYAKRKGEPHAQTEGEEIQQGAKEAVDNPKGFAHRWGHWKGFGFGGHDNEAEGPSSKKHREEPPHKRKRGAAHAYQFGNTIIVEDEDGEVIREFTLPGPEPGETGRGYGQKQLREGMRRMSTWVGRGKDTAGEKTVSDGAPAQTPGPAAEEGEGFEQALVRHLREGRENDSDEDGPDDGLRMTISRADHYGVTGQRKNVEDRQGRPITLASGRRLSTAQFFQEMNRLDPKKQMREAEASDAPEGVKRELKQSAKAQKEAQELRGFKESTAAGTPAVGTRPSGPGRYSSRVDPTDYFSAPHRPQNPRQDTSESIATIEEEIPTHDVQSAVVRHGKGRTAADERRQRLATIKSNDEDEEVLEEEGETTAERRRRLAALGIGGQSDSDSEEDDTPRRPREAVQEPDPEEVTPASRGLRVQWGGERGRERANSRGEKDKIGTGEKVGRKARGMFKHRNQGQGSS
jgi:sodium/hydrogen antiporter